MAAQQGDGSEDDATLSPVNAAILLPPTEHCLHSINSTVFIRQLPSQGLSFQLWPAATTFLTLLDDHRRNPSTGPLGPTLTALDSRRPPIKILELGSGTGLVGISAAVTLGACVTVTDLPHVVPNLLFNVEANAAVLAANGGVVHVAALRWGEAEDVEVIGREFDLVVASDVVYHDHLYEPLLKTLRLLILGGEEAEGRVFVMAHLRRWKKDSAFFKKARKLFEVEVLHVDPPCHGSRVGVTVYRFAGKNSSKKLLKQTVPMPMSMALPNNQNGCDFFLGFCSLIPQIQCTFNL